MCVRVCVCVTCMRLKLLHKYECHRHLCAPVNVHVLMVLGHCNAMPLRLNVNRANLIWMFGNGKNISVRTDRLGKYVYLCHIVTVLVFWLVFWHSKEIYQRWESIKQEIVHYLSFNLYSNIPFFTVNLNVVDVSLPEASFSFRLNLLLMMLLLLV